MNKRDESDCKLTKKNSLKQRWRRSSIFQKIKRNGSCPSADGLSGSGSALNNINNNGYELESDHSEEDYIRSNNCNDDDGLVVRYLIENKLANLDFLQPRPSVVYSDCKQVLPSGWKGMFKKRKSSEKKDEYDEDSSSSLETKYHSVNSSTPNLIPDEINESKTSDDDLYQFSCPSLHDEYKYIIFTIINPIGLADPFLTAYMNELISYTKQLLQIENEEHDSILEELKSVENLPKMIQVNLLDVCCSNFKIEDQCQVYCVLWISSPLRDGTNLHSKEMHSSRVMTLLESVSWNENFELNVVNPERDILNIRFLKKKKVPTATLR